MKRIGIALLVSFGLVATGWGLREVKHYADYRTVEKEGKLKAELSQPAVSQPPGEDPEITITVTNTGTQAWTAGEHYFALGVFERDPLGRRVEKVNFKNGVNRIVIPKEIKSGEAWAVKLQLSPPLAGKTLHFQMVEEGVTWFGQETTMKWLFASKAAGMKSVAFSL